MSALFVSVRVPTRVDDAELTCLARAGVGRCVVVNSQGVESGSRVIRVESIGDVKWSELACGGGTWTILRMSMS